jgi:hypothetical protein
LCASVAKSNAFLNGNVIFSGQNTSISNGMRLWKTDGTNKKRNESIYSKRYK